MTTYPWQINPHKKWLEYNVTTSPDLPFLYGTVKISALNNRPTKDNCAKKKKKKTSIEAHLTCQPHRDAHSDKCSKRNKITPKGKPLYFHVPRGANMKKGIKIMKDCLCILAWNGLGVRREWSAREGWTALTAAYSSCTLQQTSR